MKTYTFRVIIEPDENNTFHGFAPALRGCHTFGPTLEETRENLKDAIKACVLSLLDDDEPVPIMPMHSRDIPTGTLLGILRDCEITKQQLIDLL